MNKLMVLILLLGTLFSPLLLAESGIYKWVDENGNVNYGERPASKDAVRMKGPSHSINKDSETVADEEKKKRYEEKCAQSKNQLKAYKEAPFLYRTDEKTGAKVRLTEEETEKVFFEAEKEVNYWCNPPAENLEDNQDEQPAEATE